MQTGGGAVAACCRGEAFLRLCGQAIELSAETLGNVKFVQEKKLISQYFEQISQDTGKFCFGIDDTLKGLEMGAVQILIVWENLATLRYTLKDANSGARRPRPPPPASRAPVTPPPPLACRGGGGEAHVARAGGRQVQLRLQGTARPAPSRPPHLALTGRLALSAQEGADLEVVDKVQLVEWFASNYKNFGATLEFVTNRSQEGAPPAAALRRPSTARGGPRLDAALSRPATGSQFVKGFGGVGGILRYKVDFMEHDYDNDDSD